MITRGVRHSGQDGTTVPDHADAGGGEVTGLPPPPHTHELPPECRNCLLAASREPMAHECRARLEQLFRNAN